MGNRQQGAAAPTLSQHDNKSATTAMPKRGESKRKRTDDAEEGAQKKRSASKPPALPPITDNPADLRILPRDEWKKDAKHRLICKIEGCPTRGRSDRDDMCKKHYTMFTNAGLDTGGQSKKQQRRKKADV